MGEYADSLKKRKSTKASEAVEAAREAAALAEKERKKSKAQEKRDASRSSGRNSPISSPYPTYTPSSSSSTTVNTPSTGSSGGGSIQTPDPVTVISAPPPTGIVDNVNVKSQYSTEVRRIILSLVKSAKSLLIKYDFSSINTIPEYSLDSDASAKTEYMVAYKARPEPPFTLAQAELQDRFSLDVTEINNRISDLAEDSVKNQYFGTLRGGVLIPVQPKISNGISYYDMKLRVPSICGKDFIVKCYEIS